MSPILILFTKFIHELPSIHKEKYITKLPNELKERNSRFVRWQDRHANLFGKLLLIEGLKQYGFEDNVLTNLKYNKYSRPYLNSEIDFNISHSGEYVMCAISKSAKLGIDIEAIQGIDFKDFKKVMSAQQWQDINNSESPSRAFLTIGQSKKV